MKQQLRPLFDQVVIKELEPDRVRHSGLLLPPGEHEQPPQHGIVLAVGPGLDWWGRVGIKMPVVHTDAPRATPRAVSRMPAPIQ